MRFGILGALETPVPVGGPRPRSLLAALLLDAGQIVSAERLIDALYGEEPPSGAANALQSQVSRLRGKLGDASLIELHPSGYRLAVDREDVDAHVFTRLAAEGKRALAAGDHKQATALLSDALALWRGPALADIDAPFAEGHATRLEELRIAAVEDCAEAHLDPSELIAGLKAETVKYPLRERLRGLLMRALYAAGRQAEALAEFEDIRRVLAEELGADPSAELAAVHVALLRGDQRQAPALPAQFTSFVGREDELRVVGDRLRDSRLVTLLGPGGAGKTRLAIEAARSYEACFVDLAPLTGGVAQAVMAALGLRESGLLAAPGPADVEGRLLAALAGRELLLVLDNCEHVVADAARLVHVILGGCPGVTILATSREALGITGEVLSPVPPLSPEPAVRLFTDRARAVSPGFVADETVAHICQALDGLPLAIELAAARLRSLTVQEVATRLDDRFQLLTRGSRTAAPRHQTLRAVVEWSWELLEPDERALAEKLSVFAGGATLEAAERVCGGTVDDLASLVDKSFVEASGGRYRMLDTIRVFCAERRTENVHRAYAEYFLELARAADPHLRRAEQLDWMSRLKAEHGNFFATLRWAVEHDTELALSLVSALSWYWYLSGTRTEIIPLTARLIELVEPADCEEEYVLCVLHSVAGGPGGFEKHIARAREIMSRIGALRQPYVVVAWALFEGPPIEGEPISPMRKAFAENPDPWFQAVLKFSTGYVAWLTSGEIDTAGQLVEEGLAVFRHLGERWGLAQCLDALAAFADAAGDHTRSLAMTAEALGVMRELNAVEELADLTSRGAARLLRAGRTEEAEASYAQSAEYAKRAGVLATLAVAWSGLGEVARLRGDLKKARELQERALAQCTEDWVNANARTQIFLELGRVAALEGATAEAVAHFERAASLAHASRIQTVEDEAVAELTRISSA
ncbi:Predicted ATPase [Amycolatopsis xylanica]|uniref:Predicted ATPase n=1 Tax=Amycolatopsis xylanica TaxID=589385 RepID=A0A1H3NR58_9PSEU|nr:BTAD domain-containing putative transcriptional regulator [Amycolatopsis xylanica]SDY91278.1 Predicted ATPase [Amycolatopsis xylanica]